MPTDVASARVETEGEILAAIRALLPGDGTVGLMPARTILDLAEAFAWIYAPSQPHGVSAQGKAS